MIWGIAIITLLLLLIVVHITVDPYYDEDPPHWPDVYDDPSKAIQETCSHPETYLKVLSEIVNCEETVVACRHCGKHFGKPETDCR